MFNHVPTYGYLLPNRYHKSRLVFVWLSDLHLSRHRLLLLGAAAAIQRVRIAGLPPQNGKLASQLGAGGLTQFAQQFVSAVTATPLVGCVVCYFGSAHLHYFLNN